MTLNPETLEAFRADTHPSDRAIRSAAEAVAAHRFGHDVAIASIRGRGGRPVFLDQVVDPSVRNVEAELVAVLAGDVAPLALMPRSSEEAETLAAAARTARLAELQPTDGGEVRGLLGALGGEARLAHYRALAEQLVIEQRRAIVRLGLELDEGEVLDGLDVRALIVGSGE